MLINARLKADMMLHEKQSLFTHILQVHLKQCSTYVQQVVAPLTLTKGDLKIKLVNKIRNLRRGGERLIGDLKTTYRKKGKGGGR